MLRQHCAGRRRQCGDELSWRSLTPGEREPIILETGKLHSDQKTGLLDIQETKITPERRHLVRCGQWTEKGRLERGIEYGGNIPNQADVRLTTKIIPHRRRHR